MADYAFIRIDNWEQAQQLADSFTPDELHRILDRYAAMCCPVFGCLRAALSLEPDVGRIFHRSRVSLRADYEALKCRAITTSYPVGEG
jgi:hypothetical protein